MSVSEAVTLIAAITAAIVSIGGVVINIFSAWQGNKTHAIVNSQASKFEALAKAAGFAEGQQVGPLSAEPHLQVVPPPP